MYRVEVENDTVVLKPSSRVVPEDFIKALETARRKFNHPPAYLPALKTVMRKNVKWRSFIVEKKPPVALRRNGWEILLPSFRFRMWLVFSGSIFVDVERVLRLKPEYGVFTVEDVEPRSVVAPAVEKVFLPSSKRNVSLVIHVIPRIGSVIIENRTFGILDGGVRSAISRWPIEEVKNLLIFVEGRRRITLVRPGGEKFIFDVGLGRLEPENWKLEEYLKEIVKR